MSSPLWPLLLRFSVQEVRHHPWRNAAALLAVVLGVALAFSVHLINTSALEEFAGATRALRGQADLELRAAPGLDNSLDEAWLGRLNAEPEVDVAQPVLEISTYAWVDSAQPERPRRTALQVLGVDLLQAARMAPQLLPQLAPGQDREALFAPDAVFLNPAAQAALQGERLQLQHGLQGKAVRVVGSVTAPGAPLAVMDIAAAQDVFGRSGQLSRIDLRLHHIDAFQQKFATDATVRLTAPGEPQTRLDALSRAYRVNLTVLALVALFTGGFLVYSVVALSTARRSQQFALLGVLGLTSQQGMRLVLWEAALLGLVGSLLGLALGAALAWGALQLLGGDLGGGYFAGTAPRLQWRWGAALFFGGSGVLMAAAGAWAPARSVQRLPLAATLKGLGNLGTVLHLGWGAALLVLGVLLALLPAVQGVPVAAYLSVGALLLGGILALPWLIGAALDRLAPAVQSQALALLALERARRVRESAAVAVSGVVAALSLAVALTVMVASFRTSVADMLDNLLPADLYVRTALAGAAHETAFLEPQWLAAVAKVPGVQRVAPGRSLPVLLQPQLPPATLWVRPLRTDDARAPQLPFLGEVRAAPTGQIAVYVSEAFADLYQVKVGDTLPALSSWFAARPGQPRATFFVAGRWRDYVRQFGAIAIDSADFATLSDDRRANELALWLAPGADATTVQQALRSLAGGADTLEIASATDLRRLSLRLFDRSFAVTYWLQAVAIAIGLFGVAASFSAQVLARRREFGLLAHLGFTRRQILRVVALEGLAWTTLGAVAGLLLGLAVALVLVHVVNPQSFHWTMDLFVPWLRLLALAALVVAAGTSTAWLAGRAAASADAVLSVKEDW